MLSGFQLPDHLVKCAIRPVKKCIRSIVTNRVIAIEDMIHTAAAVSDISGTDLITTVK
jgi:hypothetical protein